MKAKWRDAGRRAARMPSLKFPLVYIEWEDSAHVGAWMDFPEVAEQDRVYPCHSVGWLVKDGQWKVLCASLTEVQGGMRVHIPKSAIRKFVILRKAQ
jgi:hypothetical protein